MTYRAERPITTQSPLALLALATTSLALACGPATPAEPTTPTGDNHTTAPTSSGDTATAANADPPAVAPTTSPASAPPLAESPFVPVYQGNISLRLYPVKGALLAGVRDLDDTEFLGVRFGVVRGDTIDFSQGMEMEYMFMEVADVVGSWPDQLDILAVGTTGRTGTAEHMTVKSGRVIGKTSTPMVAFVRAAQLGTTTLGLAEALTFGPSAIHTLRGPELGIDIAPAPADECPDAAAFQASAIAPADMAATGDGRLAVIGQHCKRGLVTLFYEPRKPVKIVDFPPALEKAAESDGTLGRLLSDGDGKLWLLGHGAARLDGEVWTTVAHAPNGVAFRTGAFGHAALWAIDHQDRLYRMRGDRFVPVPLPEGVGAGSIAADPAGTIWVAGNGVLLRHGEGKGIALTKTAPAEADRRLKLPKPGSPGCAVKNIVVLYGFTKVTPADYDFPLTRKAVAGHWELKDTRFLVTKDLGQKFFVAEVPSFEIGTKLQSLIKDEVPGSSPQIVCAEPEVVRELKINLATGAVSN